MTTAGRPTDEQVRVAYRHAMCAALANENDISKVERRILYVTATALAWAIGDPQPGSYCFPEALGRLDEAWQSLSVEHRTNLEDRLGFTQAVARIERESP